ncbi:MAG: HAD-IC family P-type ATPase [Endomicrobiia bacterium]
MSNNIDLKKNWHNLSKEDILKILNTAETGLSNFEVEKRIKQYGYNELITKKKETPLTIFLAQFKSPLIYILLVAAIISFSVGKLTNTIVIFAVLLTNAIMGFIQETRAKRIMENLRNLSSPKTKVLRENTVLEIPTKDVVVGDIILFESGTKISADARIIESIRVKVDEASLTGESHAVSKTTEILPEDTPLADRKNMVYSGTIVVSGKGKGVVVATGMQTEIGKIANIIQSTPETKTPFQRKMERFGKFIIILVATQVSIAFIIGTFVRKMPFYDIFLVALSQMVSSIPEGLPIAVTVALAIGMQRMAKRKALIRKLAAVEGLGSATVICTDKTGTLTKNEMTSRKICTMTYEVDVTGAGYSIEGNFLLTNTGTGLSTKEQKINPLEYDEIKLLLTNAILCNNSVFKFDKNISNYTFSGDSTEIAYLVLGIKSGINLETINAENPRIDEIPFESDIQLMATKNKTVNGNIVIYVKGSPEKIVNEMCGYYYKNGTIEKITDTVKKQIFDNVSSMGKNALRVLAFAFTNEEVNSKNTKLEIDNLKGKLIFTGLIGNMDPPREEVKNAILECRKAGIRIIMITGDNLITAEAVAKELGIEKYPKGVTGAELDRMSKEEFYNIVKQKNVFARIEPRHKFQIVQTLQQQGEVVAMTGDGVNDAPALATADIGVAMGITGTDVAKESSGMVIADDNFATIVNAVEEGRGITANMRKTIHYLLCSSNTEILVLLTCLIAGLPLPLFPLQILWINLITDGTLTVNLIKEPKEDVMNAPPDKKDEPIVNKEVLKLILFHAPIMAMSIFGLFLFEVLSGKEKIYASTVAFTTLAVTQWMNGINSRSHKQSIFKMPFLRNPYLTIGLTIAIILQILVLYVPFLQEAFSTVPLTFDDWVRVLLCGSIIFWAEEIRKYFVNKKIKKTKT